MTQCQKIAKIMLNNNDIKKVWTAKDFQQFGSWFIGYEATARMSDLIRMYPAAFIVGKEGKFRTLELNIANEPAMRTLVEFVRGEEDERN